MNHLPAIVAACQNAIGRGGGSFLATVVKTEGSTYRRPGARMLISLTGEAVGTVSGGCLERDIFHHIRQRPSQEPFPIAYDIKAEEDLLWGFGLGCEGTVHLLVEPLDFKGRLDAVAFLAQCLHRQQWGVLATVFRVEGLAAVKVGMRLSLDASGKMDSDIGDPNLERAIAADAQIALAHRTPRAREYPSPGGVAEAFLEVIQPPTPLTIFGAGEDAVPLAQLAKTLGWQVTVVDCRGQEATRQRFPMADQIALTRRETVSRAVQVQPDTAAVVMTHNYFDDLEILKGLLPSPVRYIGLLGSRQRTERLWQALSPQATLPAAGRLYAPAGLDIGAETPEEIALAIVAEIQAVTCQRRAGFLRERLGSIHSQLHFDPELDAS